MNADRIKVKPELPFPERFMSRLAHPRWAASVVFLAFSAIGVAWPR